MARIMAAFLALAAMATVATAGTPKALFSPKGGCEAAICKEIGKAEKTIIVAAYAYTSREIVAELAKAVDRKVLVQVIVDSSQVDPDMVSESNSMVVASYTNGIKMWVDQEHRIFHNKFIIIDGRRVITGSFNFSKSAERYNAENIVIQTDKKLAAVFQANWEEHKDHAVQFKGWKTFPRRKMSLPNVLEDPPEP